MSKTTYLNSVFISVYPWFMTSSPDSNCGIQDEIGILAWRIEDHAQGNGRPASLPIEFVGMCSVRFKQ